MHEFGAQQQEGCQLYDSNRQCELIKNVTFPQLRKLPIRASIGKNAHANGPQASGPPTRHSQLPCDNDIGNADWMFIRTSISSQFGNSFGIENHNVCVHVLADSPFSLERRNGIFKPLRLVQTRARNGI